MSTNNDQTIPEKETTAPLPSMPAEKVEDQAEDPKNLEIEQRLINELLDSYKEPITSSSIPLIVLKLMEMSEKYKELSGKQKKELVISVIKTVSENSLSKEACKEVNLIVPILIDQFMYVHEGNLEINIPEPVKNCFSMCFGMFAKKQ